MKFVKVERNYLIEQLKDYIDLLKKCPKDMSFHTCIEFCGIDKKFIEVTKKYYEKQRAAQVKEQRNQEDGNI